SEVTLWSRCGHFQHHKFVAIVDCNSSSCELSTYHPKGCYNRICERYRRAKYGPDIQTIIDTVDDDCHTCRVAAVPSSQR
ncbi:hypothetical protein B0F90DRAFT_1632959, partial [Multifurca ochricompacta]